MTLSDEESELVCRLPARVRESAPLVHCLTNMVVSNFTANVLLALGASPAMVNAPEDSEEFAARSDALLVNMGTLNSQQLLAMRLAVIAANRHSKPWVLDPITAGLSFRMRAAQNFLAQSPAAIRGNASEIIALIPGAVSSVRGADSTDRPDMALGPAQALSRQTGAVVAVSGENDYLTDGRRSLSIRGGHPLMTRVTGVGCALNAVIAAYCATAKDPFIGTLAALLTFSVAGSDAARDASGPGSFAVAFLDRLSTITDLFSHAGNIS